MATTSRYAQPLQPEKLEKAAHEVYSVHQSGVKDRGDRIEKILQGATKNQREREIITLRAQRLQLDGIPAIKSAAPKKASKTPVESPKPSNGHNHPPGKPKRQGDPKAAQGAGVKKTVNGKKPEGMPF